jgi:hypothetical protein
MTARRVSSCMLCGFNPSNDMWNLYHLMSLQHFVVQAASLLPGTGLWILSRSFSHKVEHQNRNNFHRLLLQTVLSYSKVLKRKILLFNITNTSDYTAKLMAKNFLMMITIDIQYFQSSEG